MKIFADDHKSLRGKGLSALKRVNFSCKM